MVKKILTKEQSTTLLGGLLAIWLLLTLSSRTVSQKPLTNCQTFITIIDLWPESEGSGYASPDFIHVPIALINSSSGFSFIPPAGFLSCIQCLFHQKVKADVASVLQLGCRLFEFRLLILEHQIAINAP